ncbi:hypothetical protein [Phenylobacterium sp.]|uniref:hypothetical protein n=1 Tax=Phenylobacterium sp. TaxID=1871053 RepID=UPI00301BBE3B
MSLSDQWGEVLIAALSGGVVTKAFEWWRQRGKDRKIARDEVAAAARDVVRTALESAGGQVERLEAEVEGLRDDVAQMRAAHAQEMADMRARHAACERLTAELRAEIDRLMAGPVATYPAVVAPKRRRRSRAKPASGSGGAS